VVGYQNFVGCWG